MEKLPLSLVVITKNEEENIERCLRSVTFASEILVVDSFSDDRTVEVARREGARVVQEEWQGFGPQKKFATEQAQFDWILSLDADEALSPELADEIRRRFAGLDRRTAYRLPRLSLHLGRWIRHGGWYPDLQVRLYNRKHADWGNEEIHEHVRAERFDRLEHNLLHWVFDDIADQVRTNDRYSSLQARELHRRGHRFSLFRLITKPPVKFLETYFWKAGFLDGMAGFLISVSAAYSVFLKHAKVWEIEREAKP